MRTATLVAAYVLTLMAGFNPDRLPPGFTAWPINAGGSDRSICCPEGDDKFDAGMTGFTPGHSFCCFEGDVSPYVFDGATLTPIHERMNEIEFPLPWDNAGVDYETDTPLAPKSDPTTVNAQIHRLDVDAKLNLTLLQKAKIAIVIEDVMAKAKALVQANATREQLEALGAERHRRIEAELTPEQRAKFDRIAGHN